MPTSRCTTPSWRGVGRRAGRQIERRRTAIERRRLVDEFIAGLGRGEIVAHLQPIVETRTRRLRQPGGAGQVEPSASGPAWPAAFLDLIEDAGLGVDLGDAVLESACDTLDRLAAHGHQPNLSVNLSVAQLTDARDHCADRADHPQARPGARPARDRDHRTGHPGAAADGCRRVLRPDLARPARLRGDAHARRFRYRLLVAHPRAPLSPRRRQDRPQLRQRHARRPRGPRRRRSDHRTGTRAGPALGRRRGRVTPSNSHALDALGCDRVQGHVIAEPMAGDATIDWILHR